MGDAEMRLDEVVAAYAALARGGVALPTTRVRSIDGAPAPRARGERLVSPRSAFWVTDILADQGARAWVFGTGGSLDFPFPVAVKTGTSQAYRDNWTIGYTREVTVGVWVGNFDRAPLRNSSGVTGAAPIFHDVLLAAQRRVAGRLPEPGDGPLAAPPPGVERRMICALSGRAATPLCPRVEWEWLPAGPFAPCAWHRHDAGRTVVDWPPAYRAWAAGRGLVARVTRAASTPPARQGPSRASAPQPPLVIVNPPPDGTYLRDPTLPARFQTLPLRASGDGSSRTVTWAVDGKTLASAGLDAAVDWPLAAGRHTIAVADDKGRTATTIITVR
jgi:penicillin-binding protein 1C